MRGERLGFSANDDPLAAPRRLRERRREWARAAATVRARRARAATSRAVRPTAALSPRRRLGWRSWNLYGGNVNQTLIEGIMASMVRRSSRYTVDGVPTSLCDLGFCDVGLDDNWQACGRHGEGGYMYHDEEGNPLVNSERFPSMKSMTSYAHSLGLTAGWYGNNCICSEKKTGDRRFYAGDVRAMREMGFDSWKLDGCGAQTDMQLWSDLIQAAAGRRAAAARPSPRDAQAEARR